MTTLTLERTEANGSVTWGRLSCKGEGWFSVETMEGKLPKADTAYSVQTLPAGQYRIIPAMALVRYKGRQMELPWFYFCPVPHYPRAGFYGDDGRTQGGQIQLSLGRVDDFTPDRRDEAVFKLAQLANKLIKAGETEAVLDIRECRDTMQISSFSIIDKQREEAYAEEMRERQEHLDFLKSLDL